MNAFQRWLLWTASILTGVTGLVYLWMDRFLEPVDPWAVINHPLQPAVLKLHILVAPVLVFAVGLIATEHVWRHLRQRVRAGRRSGLVALAVLLPMVLSGYLIQAVTAPAWLAGIAWTHIVTGCLYLLALVAHHRVFRTRRGVRRSRSARGRAARASGPGGAFDRPPPGEAGPPRRRPARQGRTERATPAAG